MHKLPYKNNTTTIASIKKIPKLPPSKFWHKIAGCERLFNKTSFGTFKKTALLATVFSLNFIVADTTSSPRVDVSQGIALSCGSSKTAYKDKTKKILRNFYTPVFFFVCFFPNVI